MRRQIVILALAGLCAAASPSRAEQASAKDHRARASAATSRPPRAAPVRVRTRPPARKKPRLLDPRAAIRSFLVLPTTALATTPVATADLQWTRGEWDTRPVAATTSGIVPSMSTDDWRLLVAAGLSGFALVSPITPAMGFPGLRTHQRPPAGLVCLAGDQLGLCLPAISAVKDPYHDSRWAGISLRLFETRF
jgi:hypothetical protein